MSPEALAALHAAAFTQDSPWSADAFRSQIADTHTHLTVLRDGFALWRAVAQEAELLTIAVHPEAQGRGLGTELMQVWMAEAADQADTAFLEVASDNRAARALYARCGFETVGRRAGYYRRATDHADALVMRAPLGGAT